MLALLGAHHIFHVSGLRVKYILTVFYFDVVLFGETFVKAVTRSTFMFQKTERGILLLHLAENGEERRAVVNTVTNLPPVDIRRSFSTR